MSGNGNKANRTKTNQSYLWLVFRESGLKEKIKLYLILRALFALVIGGWVLCSYYLLSLFRVLSHWAWLLGLSYHFMYKRRSVIMHAETIAIEIPLNAYILCMYRRSLSRITFECRYALSFFASSVQELLFKIRLPHALKRSTWIEWKQIELNRIQIELEVSYRTQTTLTANKSPNSFSAVKNGSIFQIIKIRTAFDGRYHKPFG